MRVNLPDEGVFGMDPADGDIWALKLPGFGPTEDSIKATQWGFSYIEGEAGSRFELNYTSSLGVEDVGRWGNIWTTPGTVELGLADPTGTLVYGVRRFVLTIDGTTWPGKDVTIYCEPVLGGVAGAVDGTEVLPAGAVINLKKVMLFVFPQPLGTITLSKPLKVGDREMQGDFEMRPGIESDVAIEDGDVAWLYYWSSDTPDGRSDTTIPTEEENDGYNYTFFSGSVTVGGHAVDGTLVSGFPYIRLSGPANEDDGNADQVFQFFDDVSWRYIPASGEQGTITFTAEMAEGVPGQTVTLPVTGGPNPAGDGPTYDTPTGLRSRLP